MSSSFCLASTPATATPVANTRYFAATGHSVNGIFLQFFDRYGGVPTFGYPLTEQVVENNRPVQYFERQRFEYHQEAAGTQYEVQLGHLGKELAAGRVSFAAIPPSKETSTGVYVRETGHSLSQPFLGYWKTHGDVRIIGYPITEPLNEGGLTVQYFERARMEYHPEKTASGYTVELGHLGKEYMARHSMGGEVAQNPQNASSAMGAIEQLLFEYINRARAAAGSGPVSADGTLTSIARFRSNDMATRGYFSHDTPEGTDFITLLRTQKVPFKATGEIIQQNNRPQDQIAYAAGDWFMNSPVHRPILLDPRFNAVGIGEALDGRGLHTFTAIFTQR
ncbi:MAG TPA: CAP domain-containing protein [Chloroflexia bacterium]